MRKIALLILFACLLVSSCNTTLETRIVVNNPMDLVRNDAIILLTRGAISNWTEIPAGLWPALKDESGSYIPSQVDDVDGDGVWDELFALTDMEPSGQKILSLTFVSPEEYPSFEKRTNLRLGSHEKGYPELLEAERLEGVSYHNYGGRTSAVYQMEGPAWENDKVGFRNYMDQRNGMDIFGKLTPKMVLDSVGVEGSPSYHGHADWGMDVLKVGTSLGSGGIGYLYNDSIYRVGDNGSGTYKVVFEGPLHSRFNLSYTNWNVDGMPLEVIHQIEIIAGRHYFQGMVTYSGSEAQLDLVPGIVNMKSDTLYMLQLNENYTGFVTHDYQSEDSTLLALALIVPTVYLKSYGETRDSGEGITQTYYAVLEAVSGKPTPYRFYALWEKEDPRWASLKEVSDFLEIEAERWTQSTMLEILP